MQEGKPLKCSRCGQVGKTLVKLDEITFVCQDETFCRNRGKGTCSVFWCSEPAEYNCSCGMQLCKVHLDGLQHGNHFAKRIK